MEAKLPKGTRNKRNPKTPRPLMQPGVHRAFSGVYYCPKCLSQYRAEMAMKSELVCFDCEGTALAEEKL